MEIRRITNKPAADVLARIFETAANALSHGSSSLIACPAIASWNAAATQRFARRPPIPVNYHFLPEWPRIVQILLNLLRTSHQLTSNLRDPLRGHAERRSGDT